jgi:hypothetical protein
VTTDLREMRDEQGRAAQAPHHVTDGGLGNGHPVVRGRAPAQLVLCATQNARSRSSSTSGTTGIMQIRYCMCLKDGTLLLRLVVHGRH